MKYLENKACLTFCGNQCTCEVGVKWISSMPIIKTEKPVDFMKAMNKFLKWAKKNRKNGYSYGEIIIHTYADGGYIRMNNEDSITVNFTHWVYPPIKSAKELLKMAKKKKFTAPNSKH